MHWWVTIRSTCSGSESYVDDGFWNDFFGNTEYPCGGDYPYGGPHTVGPDLAGPFPTPYAPIVPDYDPFPLPGTIW